MSREAGQDFTLWAEQKVEEVMKRLDTSKLQDYSMENLSIVDIENAMRGLLTKGYLRGVSDTTENLKKTEAVISVGDEIRIDHPNGSHLKGTMMPEGVLSTPAKAATLDAFGQNGWAITYIDHKDPDDESEADDE